MTKDLYFLRLICDAILQPNPNTAIVGAFQKIIELGQQPEYMLGFQQFKRFMAVIKDSIEGESKKTASKTGLVLNDLILQISNGLIEGDHNKIADFIKLIRFHPDWQENFDQMQQKYSIADARIIQLQIIIEKNEEIICSIPVEDDALFKKINNLTPGLYFVKLNTGRILWQGELTDQDLVWTTAFPETDLAMAADTGDHADHVTREISLLAGNLVIRVIPALEGGCIELEFRN